MPYIQQNPNTSGAYPSPQGHAAPGLIPLTDEQASLVVQYNGFVTITSHEEEYEEGFFRTIYEVTPNTEAWEAWKAAEAAKPTPTPEPTTDELLDILLGVNENG